MPAPVSRRPLCQLGLPRQLQLRFRLNASKTTFCEPWRCSAHRQFCSARASWRCQLVVPRCCLATSAASPRPASPAPAHASRRQLCQPGLPRQLHLRSRPNASKTTFCGPWRCSAPRQFCSARASWHSLQVLQRCCLATSAALQLLASPVHARASRRPLCRLEVSPRLELLHRVHFPHNASKTTFCGLWRCSAPKRFSSAQASWHSLQVLRQCCLATSAALRRPASPVHARVSRRLLCRLEVSRQLELLHQVHFPRNASKMTFCGLWRCSATRQPSSARASWRYQLVYQPSCLATSAALRRPASPVHARVSRRLLCRLEVSRQLELLHQVHFPRNASKMTFCGLWRCSATRQPSSARDSWRYQLVYQPSCLATSAASRRPASPALARASRRLWFLLLSALPVHFLLSASKTTLCGHWRRLVHRHSLSARDSWLCLLGLLLSCQATSAASLHRRLAALALASKKQPFRRATRRARLLLSPPSASKMMSFERSKHSPWKLVRCVRVC